MRWHYTVRRGEIAQQRKETYKSMQAYERAFYKFICKQGWFSNLRDGYRPPEPNGNGGYWMQGYPCFRSWRSDAYQCFNIAGEHGLRRGYEKRRAQEIENKRREEEEYERNKKRFQRLTAAELETGYGWWYAASFFDLPPLHDHELPMELLEAKQYHMGLTTLINQLKKKKKPIL